MINLLLLCHKLIVGVDDKPWQNILNSYIIITDKKVTEVYNDRIFLTPQEILEKEFKVDARGYRPQEVDKFLDMVIRDYSEYLSIIKKQEKDIKDLTEDNMKLKQELRRLKTTIAAAENGEVSGTRSVNNVDLLRRISQLEKIVFGKDE